MKISLNLELPYQLRFKIKKVSKGGALLKQALPYNSIIPTRHFHLTSLFVPRYNQLMSGFLVYVHQA